MDFLQTIFKTNISLLPIFQNCIIKGQTQIYDLVLRFKSEAKIYRIRTQNYDLVLRFKSEAKIYKDWTQNYELVLRFKNETKSTEFGRKIMILY